MQILLVVLEFWSWPWLVIPHSCRTSLTSVYLGALSASTLAYSIYVNLWASIISCGRLVYIRAALSSTPSSTVRDRVSSLQFSSLHSSVEVPVLAAFGHSERKLKSSTTTHSCLHWLSLQYHYHVSAASLHGGDFFFFFFLVGQPPAYRWYIVCTTTIICGPDAHHQLVWVSEELEHNLPASLTSRYTTTNNTRIYSQHGLSNGKDHHSEILRPRIGGP